MAQVNVGDVKTGQAHVLAPDGSEINDVSSFTFAWSADPSVTISDPAVATPTLTFTTEGTVTVVCAVNAPGFPVHTGSLSVDVVPVALPDPIGSVTIELV